METTSLPVRAYLGERGGWGWRGQREKRREKERERGGERQGREEKRSRERRRRRRLSASILSTIENHQFSAPPPALARAGSGLCRALSSPPRLGARPVVDARHCRARRERGAEEEKLEAGLSLEVSRGLSLWSGGRERRERERKSNQAECLDLSPPSLSLLSLSLASLALRIDRREIGVLPDDARKEKPSEGSEAKRQQRAATWPPPPPPPVDGLFFALSRREGTKKKQPT